jgi:hypothetical protein
MLHGNGGNSSFINSMGTTLNSAIRVAPNGYSTSWNVDSEVSKAPDVAFIFCVEFASRQPQHHRWHYKETPIRQIGRNTAIHAVT